MINAHRRGHIASQTIHGSSDRRAELLLKLRGHLRLDLVSDGGHGLFHVSSNGLLKRALYDGRILLDLLLHRLRNCFSDVLEHRLLGSLQLFLR